MVGNDRGYLNWVLDYQEMTLYTSSLNDAIYSRGDEQVGSSQNH